MARDTIPIVVRLERDSTFRQEKINAAVRQLDTAIAMTSDLRLEDHLRKIQNDLRAKQR